MIFTSFLLFFVASFSHYHYSKTFLVLVLFPTLGYFKQMFLKRFVCIPLSACRKSQVNFFLLLSWTAMNEKCFLQFIILSAARNFLFTIFSANFALLHFCLLICFVVQWTSHQFQKFLFPQDIISQSYSPNLGNCTFDPSGCWICISWILEVFPQHLQLVICTSRSRHSYSFFMAQLRTGELLQLKQGGKIPPSKSAWCTFTIDFLGCLHSLFEFISK